MHQDAALLADTVAAMSVEGHSTDLAGVVGWEMPASPRRRRSRARAKSFRFIRSSVKPLREKYYTSVFQKFMIVFAHPVLIQRDVTANRHET